MRYNNDDYLKVFPREVVPVEPKEVIDSALPEEPAKPAEPPIKVEPVQPAESATPDGGNSDGCDGTDH